MTATIKTILKDLMKDKAISGVLVTNTEADLIADALTDKKHRREALMAATSALVPLSNLTFAEGTEEKAKTILTFTDDMIFLTVVIQGKILVTALLNRYKMGETSVEKYRSILEKSALKIVGVHLASKYSKRSLLGKLKKAIPEATSIGILTKDGIPIAADTELDPALLAGAASAIYTSMQGVSDAIRFFIIVGEEKSALIVYTIDQTRLLAVQFENQENVTQFIPQIRDILEQSTPAPK
ncbi:MAG: hypothetical protein ACW976_04925 [Candidatus Ranarchaeia archaeon]|jgi:predicted regulator of Ras-like GTPase activity (Roadblock/LC7/MglB family)